MDEVALEKKCPKLESVGSNGEEDEEMDVTGSPELPWCVLCNDDARFRCLDCGGDLYCSKCNAEAHRNWGDEDHRIIEFKPK